MSEQTRNILGTWEEEVLGFSPDVIVLVYGHYETLHLILPRWLERHANSLKARPRRLESFYRRRILQRVWMLLARLQARLDPVIDPTSAAAALAVWPLTWSASSRRSKRSPALW